MPLVRFFQVTALFLVVFVGQLFIDGFHALTGANMFPYSEPLHLATESYGPDGRYGQHLTYPAGAHPRGLAAVRRGLRRRQAARRPAPRFLVTGAAVAAGRGHGDGGDDDPDGGAVAGVRRTLRPPSGAGLSAALAPGLPARGLVGGHRARRGHGAAALVAGLLGPIAIAVYAAVLSLPVWIAWWWLARRG